MDKISYIYKLWNAKSADEISVILSDYERDVIKDGVIGIKEYLVDNKMYEEAVKMRDIEREIELKTERP